MKNKKWIIAIGILIAFILVIVVCSVVAANQKPMDKPDTPPAVIDGEGNEMNPETVYAMPKAMVFRTSSTQHSGGGTEEEPDTVVTVTARIEPANATDQTVDWTAAWVNSSSAWADGKDVKDYIVVTPVSDGALTATVKCAEAFGEQVKITVTSRDNPNAKAECSVDYAKKLTNVILKYSKCYVNEDSELTFIAGQTGYFLNLFTSYASTGLKTAKIEKIESVGTADDTFTTTVTASFTEQFLQNLKAYNGLELSPITLDITNGISPNTKFAEDLFGKNNVNDPVAYNKIIAGIKMFGAGSILKFTVTANGTYSSLEKDFYCSISTQYMNIRTTGVTLNDTTLVF